MPGTRSSLLILKTSVSTRPAPVALVGIVALALVVRLAGAGDRLTTDEGYSWLVGSAPDAGTFLDRLAEFENTPPLFYALLTPLPLDDEVWVRLPSIAAGVAAVAALYFAVRALAGSRVGLVAALGLAVAPYHVSFSNTSRGFVLAGLGLVLALWAAARLVRGGDRRWWALYAGGAVVAVYSEYDAALTLVPLVGALIAAGLRPWRRVALLGLAPLLSLLPWVPELLRSLDKIDVTKVAPIYPSPSPGVLRDEIVPLFFGEHGATFSEGVHTLQFLAVAGALATASWLIWRREGEAPLGPEPAGVRRPVFWLLAGTAAGTLMLHAVAAFAGLDLFAVRYLTALIPLSAALLACGLALVPWRPALPLAAIVLLGLGIGIFLYREGRELEPDLGRAQALARAADTELILTNSAVASFYLRDLGVVLDRPFGLGPGLEQPTRARGVSYAVVDDRRVGDGPRAGPGRPVTLSAPAGDFVVRVVPERAGRGR